MISQNRREQAAFFWKMPGLLACPRRLAPQAGLDWRIDTFLGLRGMSQGRSGTLGHRLILRRKRDHMSPTGSKLRALDGGVKLLGNGSSRAASLWVTGISLARGDGALRHGLYGTQTRYGLTLSQIDRFLGKGRARDQ